MMAFTGFTFGSELELMFQRLTTPVHEQDVPSTIHMVHDSKERFEHTLFLAKQFFGHMDASFLNGISTLTANAPKCELVRTADQYGGAMLFESHLALGLYNIAVASERRHRGHGTRLIRECQLKAQARNLNCTLQCIGALTPFYENLGFRRYAKVTLMRSH